ncbi:HAD family hydrolase [uncultured Enorma sp.]|uniref:HAD family hydrolase n=1 Tax=uncultured Enorma sp. TaxID=1714346 RepID=UPI0028040BB6|nr:HAD family hydrolase [uncultured Enorma sp.]
MDIPYLPEVPTGELRERLACVRYVFTDLDGTMMGPNSTVLANAAGEPSLEFVQTLIELKQAGVSVVPTSGRNRAMMREDTRLLGLNAFISEMGGIVMTDLSHDTWEYFTAEMEYDPSCGLTPHEVIEQTGLCEAFITRYPGMLEYHNDMSAGYKHREVTIGLRGEIPDEEAIALLNASGMALDWADNGFLNYISAPTTLELPEGVRGRAFNVMPKGLNKGRGIERFCEIMGIPREETIGIGDAASDFLMADYTGIFIMVENGLKDPGAEEFLVTHDNAFVAPGRTVDAWVAGMRSLLEAIGR